MAARRQARLSIGQGFLSHWLPGDKRYHDSAPWLAALWSCLLANKLMVTSSFMSCGGATQGSHIQGGSALELCPWAGHGIWRQIRSLEQGSCSAWGAARAVPGEGEAASGAGCAWQLCTKQFSLASRTRGLFPCWIAARGTARTYRGGEMASFPPESWAPALLAFD